MLFFTQTAITHFNNLGQLEIISPFLWNELSLLTFGKGTMKCCIWQLKDSVMDAGSWPEKSSASLTKEEKHGSLLQWIYISSEVHCRVTIIMSLPIGWWKGNSLHRMHTKGNSPAEIPQSGPRRCGSNPSGQTSYTETSQFIGKSGLYNSCSTAPVQSIMWEDMKRAGKKV